MKDCLRKLFASAALLSLMTFPLNAFAGPKAPQPAARPAPPQAGKRRGGERHPEIRAAIQALERAKRHLQEAAHDFGGHRAEALEAVNHALEQLKLALQYDKN